MYYVLDVIVVIGMKAVVAAGSKTLAIFKSFQLIKKCSIF